MELPITITSEKNFIIRHVKSELKLENTKSGSR